MLPPSYHDKTTSLTPATFSGPAVEGFIRSISRHQPAVAVVLDPGDVVAVAEHLKHVDLPSKPTWLIGI